MKKECAMHKWIKADGAGGAMAFGCAMCVVEIETYCSAGYGARYGDERVASSHADHVGECAGAAMGVGFGGAALAHGLV